MSKKAKAVKAPLKYIVTLQREVTQLQKTKILIEVLPEEVEEGWDSAECAEDKAVKIAEETDEEYEDEKGNVTQDNAQASKVNWVNVTSEDPEDKHHPLTVVAVRKFRPSQQ